MKILYVITGLGIGGAERIVCDLADKMVGLGHIVEIVCLTGNASTLPKSNIEINFLNLNSIFNLYNSFKKIKKIISNYNPDIIHAHMFHAILLVRLSKTFLNKNIIISHAHNTSYGNFYRALLYRFTNFLSDLNVNVSYEATDKFIEDKVFDKEKTITVVNGIDINKYKKDSSIRSEFRKKFSLSEEDTIFINVASLTSQKDHINLLNAYYYVLNKGLNKSHLYIVGDGPLRNELENEINRLDIKNKVTLLGLRKDIDKLLNMADIFVLSSAWEGLPLVVAEAMATEKVVISTDCGGVKEIIDDKGSLVDIKNHIALGDKMLEFVSLSADLKLEIGLKNRTKVKNAYSLDSMAERWDNIYKNFKV